MRVGLVLGAGGVMGGAWLAGAIEAIAAETGWDPAGADYLVGTSAGSITAALLATGVPTTSVAPTYRRELLSERPDEGSRGLRSGGAGSCYRLHQGLPIPGPGSWRLALHGATRPWQHRPAALLAGWMPRGVISHEPLRRAVRAAGPGGWPEHPKLRVVACDYGTGRRVVFGGARAPSARVEDAVTASCAVPGFFRPVTIGGRRYIDGAVWSPSNLDVLRDEALDVVVCLNPTSSLADVPLTGPAELLARPLRQASGRRLGREAKRLRAAGTAVALIQPLAADLAAMGPNLMRRSGVANVIEVARRTTTEQLRRREMSTKLPALAGGYGSEAGARSLAEAVAAA